MSWWDVSVVSYCVPPPFLWIVEWNNKDCPIFCVCVVGGYLTVAVLYCMRNPYLLQYHAYNTTSLKKSPGNPLTGSCCLSGVQGTKWTSQSEAAATAWTEDKSSHLETWIPGMLDHQRSGMHTLCLITSSVVHVKVADVTWLTKLVFVLRHCSCAVWHHYAWTLMLGENISERVRVGELFCLLLWVHVNVTEC